VGLVCGGQKAAVGLDSRVGGGLVFPVARCDPSSWTCVVIRIPLKTVHRTVKRCYSEKARRKALIGCGGCSRWFARFFCSGGGGTCIPSGVPWPIILDVCGDLDSARDRPSDRQRCYSEKARRKALIGCGGCYIVVCSFLLLWWDCWPTLDRAIDASAPCRGVGKLCWLEMGENTFLCLLDMGL